MNMKNRIIKIISLLIVFSVVLGLCSCKLTHKEIAGIMTTVRQVTLPTSSKKSAQKTDFAVSAIAPEGDEAIIKYFNGSLNRFYEKDFEFTRKKTTTLESYSAGTLASVSGATQSYLSTLKSACSDMMGVSSNETNYYFGDDISFAFSIKPASEDVIQKCSASAEGSNVKITLNYKSYKGDLNDSVGLLTGDYMTVSDFAKKIKTYGASCQNAKSFIDGIKLVAVIDYSTRNFVSLKIEYKTSFSVDEMGFDYVSGGPVKGTTKTVITYGNIKEK